MSVHCYGERLIVFLKSQEIEFLFLPPHFLFMDLYLFVKKPTKF
jgi:hypothetical protein